MKTTKNEIIKEMFVILQELEYPISKLNEYFECLMDYNINREYKDDLEYWYKILIGTWYLNDVKDFLKVISED